MSGAFSPAAVGGVSLDEAAGVGFSAAGAVPVASGAHELEGSEQGSPVVGSSRGVPCRIGSGVPAIIDVLTGAKACGVQGL
ncbi:MAG: hypothetical protein A2Z37_14345 [Chloroflexi bacterium RBG_19FT_COMBO_62_14]|nr:MAG: hypothetical protein A2Z37_14345 [Chloroflexi bacterium RBG_19FT_COMBO_62_14]